MKLSLEKPVYGGDCLGRVSDSEDKTGNANADKAVAGKAVFVPLTLPGEVVRAHLTEEKRSFARAEIDAILTPSPNRIEGRCPYFGRCGGCHYQHADYPTQQAMKRQILRETLARAGVALPAEIGQLAADPWAYRNRIRLALTRDGQLSYRGRGSHDLVSVNACPIAAPILFETAQGIAKSLIQTPGPTPISELELFACQDQSQLLITLFCENAPATDPPSWLAALQTALPPETAGIRLQLSDGALTPKILSSTGQPSLNYIAAGFTYRVDHGAFFQVNRWLIDEFVALTMPNGTGKLAWDLFAGVGLFARQLTSHFSEILAVESAHASLAALQHNLAGTDGQAVASTTFEFLRRNREEREPRPDFIVLDPPRAGLGDEVTALLNAIHAPEMVYVSCDPATLARDLRQLTRERYRIDGITLVDIFPQTFHMETVVRLLRT
jgi:23S rRNA (uracil1939-C5)-methyltransferase